MQLLKDIGCLIVGIPLEDPDSEAETDIPITGSDRFNRLVQNGIRIMQRSPKWYAYFKAHTRKVQENQTISCAYYNGVTVFNLSHCSDFYNPVLMASLLLHEASHHEDNGSLSFEATERKANETEIAFLVDIGEHGHARQRQRDIEGRIQRSVSYWNQGNVKAKQQALADLADSMR